MAGKRSYGDPCGVARALDLVGERWALLVVRELLLGPKRFTDLRHGLPHLSADVLAQRMRELEEVGVVRRSTLPPPAASRVYELTDWGRELEPVVLALGRWGSRAPMPATDADLGTDAVVIALKTLFDPGRAGERDVAVELCLGGQVFAARVADRRLEVSRGPAQGAQATIETDAPTLAGALWHAPSPGGQLSISGDAAAADFFLSLFPPPQPAPRT